MSYKLKVAFPERLSQEYTNIQNIHTINQIKRCDFEISQAHVYRLHALLKATFPFINGKETFP